MRKPNVDRALRDLGRRIAELRHDRMLTQVVLAEASGIDAKHLQLIESGRQNTTVKTLFQLAHALGVHPSELLESPKTRAPRRAGRPRKT